MFNTVKRKGNVGFALSLTSTTARLKLRARARVREMILKDNFKGFIPTILRKNSHFAIASETYAH